MSIGRLPLHGVHESLGAGFEELGGSLVPANYGDTAGEYEAARSRVGISDLSDRGKLRLSGKDHLKFLQGMLTNDVMKLGEGEGMYAAILTVKGRMLSDMRVYREKESVLLDLEPGLNMKVGEILRGYRLSYKANIDDLTGSIGLLYVHGPLARRLLVEATGVENLPQSEFGHLRAAIDGRDVTVVKVRRTGGEGYDVYATADVLSDIWNVLTENGKAHGIVPVGRAAIETLRIEAGIPVYGTDMDEETIPIEAGIWNALSFEKGCYVGQEVVARIKWRGHVNRHLSGLVLSGEIIPRKGSGIFSGEKKIGFVTSAVLSPAMAEPIALGYVRREYIEPGTSVLIKLPDDSLGEARVTPLPFAGAKGVYRPE